jgi:NAD(P)-dependent dehydrogenase (short-subunit alcohol dehydrogenase family)
MNDPTAHPDSMEGKVMTCTRTHTLVTGASSGIGRATALRLAAAGQHVYAGVRTEADGAELAHAAAGWELTPLILDVTDTDQIAAACAIVTEHVGTAGLDGLVDNAGIGVAAPAELLPLDTFRRLLEINVIGQLAVTQAFLPLLRSARGRIVMISTIGVRFRPPFAGPLDATKAALAELAHALRQELAPWGIRVILVEPASIASPAADKVAHDAADTLAAAEPQRRALYEDTFTNMIAQVVRREKNGSPPDVAAETIVRALTARRPRTTYLTGKYARRMATISLLPTRVLDAVRRRIFGLPGSGSRILRPERRPDPSRSREPTTDAQALR